MRFLRLRGYLREAFDAHAPALVAYEEVRRHLGVDAAHVYGGILAVLSEECETRGVPYVGVPVGTIKKRATGRGNADKVAMVLAAHGAWPRPEGWCLRQADEADARWIAETAWGLHAGSLAVLTVPLAKVQTPGVAP